MYNAGIVTALLTNPQPIIRHEVLDSNHSLLRQRYNQEIPVLDSEIPPSYSDIFSVQPGRFLCASPTGHDYGTASQSITEVCFLRLSAGDANWIHQKFASVPPGELLDRNDLWWSKRWSQEASDIPTLHDDPLEEIDSDEIQEQTTGIVFLKWLTLRLLINRVNPKDLIHYSEIDTAFTFSNKKELRFIPYDPASPRPWENRGLGFTFRVDYYISLHNNCLFRIEWIRNSYM